LSFRNSFGSSHSSYSYFSFPKFPSSTFFEEEGEGEEEKRKTDFNPVLM